MKTGDTVMTTMGPGVIVHFELHQPLTPKDVSPTFLDCVPPTLPEGSYVRAGVQGTASAVKPVAYFSLLELSPIPEP